MQLPVAANHYQTITCFIQTIKRNYQTSITAGSDGCQYPGRGQGLALYYN